MYNVKIVNNPLKLVLLNGKLTEKNSTLRCQLCQDYIDIRIGNWNVAIRDISFSASKLPSAVEFINVSTNLVTGKQMDTNQSLRLFDPPLERFEISTRYPKKLITFQEHWFSVNAQTDLVELDFQFWPSLQLPQGPYDIDVNVSLLLYRFQ